MTTSTTEFFHGGRSSGNEYLARLHWTPGETIHVVEFALFQVRTCDPGPRLYGDQFQPEPCEPELTGSVKWDGCTSFHPGDCPLHVCNADALTQMFATLAEVRRVALVEVMGRAPC